METHVLYDCDLYQLTICFLSFPLFLGSQECLRNITHIPCSGGQGGGASFCFALNLPYALSSLRIKLVIAILNFQEWKLKHMENLCLRTCKSLHEVPLLSAAGLFTGASLKITTERRKHGQADEGC